MIMVSLVIDHCSAHYDSKAPALRLRPFFAESIALNALFACSLYRA